MGCICSLCCALLGVLWKSLVVVWSCVLCDCWTSCNCSAGGVRAWVWFVWFTRSQAQRTTLISSVVVVVLVVMVVQQQQPTAVLVTSQKHSSVSS